MARKEHWFKAKRYGWGWYPATWQGWLCVVAYVPAVALSLWLVGGAGQTSALALAAGFLVGIGASVALIWISWRRGEQPRWRWGEDESRGR